MPKAQPPLAPFDSPIDRLITGPLTKLCLTKPTPLQRADHQSRQEDGALTLLRLWLPLDIPMPTNKRHGALDAHRPRLKVHRAPPECRNFAMSHPGRQSQHHERFQWMIARRPHKLHCLFFRESMRRIPHLSRQGDQVSDIARDEFPAHGIAKGFMQNLESCLVDDKSMLFKKMFRSGILCVTHKKHLT